MTTLTNLIERVEAEAAHIQAMRDARLEAESVTDARTELLLALAEAVAALLRSKLSESPLASEGVSAAGESEA